MPALLVLIQPLMAPAFSLWGSAVSWLEMAAFWLSIAMVLCNMRVHPVAWPLAIVSSALYGLLFADARMYGEATLQLFFIVVAFWGWWQWLRGTDTDGAALHVRALPRPLRGRILLATALAWPALALLLAARTNSDVPWWDALPTAGSLAGQWLLGRMYTENWPVWTLVNLVSITLFAYKGLWLTVLLYAIFTALAIQGWRVWLRQQGACA